MIFDLDGTLADSFPWFLRHVNGLADRFGFKRIATEDIDALRRLGSREIVRQLDVSPWKLPMIGRHVRRLKALHLGEIALFPGVEPMLHGLREGGLELALVSSDSEQNAKAQLGPANAALFSHFACGASLFGKAAKFRRLLKTARFDPAVAISIGDEVRDIEAARAAGIACGAVTWGYAAPEALASERPDATFSSPGEVVEALLGAWQAPRPTHEIP